MGEAGQGPALAVTVAYSPGPRQVWERVLQLPAGVLALEALGRSGLYEAFPELAGRPLDLAVWGRPAEPSQPLRAHDRLEVLRPLLVDPKVARRERFQRQGVRSAGLFSKRAKGR